MNVLVNKFQITFPPKFVETVLIIQHHQFTFAIYIWITNIQKSHKKSLGTNLPKFILRPSYFEANLLPISTKLILSVSSLWIDRIDRLLNRLVVIVKRSHVLILQATEKDLSGVQEVARLINIRWAVVLVHIQLGVKTVSAQAYLKHFYNYFVRIFTDCRCSSRKLI